MVRQLLTSDRVTPLTQAERWYETQSCSVSSIILSSSKRRGIADNATQQQQQQQQQVRTSDVIANERRASTASQSSQQLTDWTSWLRGAAPTKTRCFVCDRGRGCGCFKLTSTLVGSYTHQLQLSKRTSDVVRRRYVDYVNRVFLKYYPPGEKCVE